MNVLKVYRSLDPEQKRILAEKQVDLNRPVAELLTLLKPIAACDTVADKARTPLGCSCAAFIVATIGLAIFASNTGPSWSPMAVIVVGLVLIISTAWLFQWTRKIDVSNNMRQFVVPALTLMKDDFDPTTPVHVHLDLRAPTDDAKKISESKPYEKGVYHKIIDSVFVDRWITFEGVLTDGTKLEYRITDKIRERKKTKRNARGKYKTKTKYRKVTEVEVEVGLRNKTYAVDKSAGDVTAGPKRNVVHVEHRMRSDSIEPIPVDALLDVIAGIYRNARPAGKEA
jgi:ribosome-associated translation inhibitor RaiA